MEHRINVAYVIGTPPGYDHEEPDSPSNPKKPMDEDNDKVPVMKDVNIFLEKSSNIDEFTEVGQEVEYTFVITNIGNVTLTDIVLDDPMLGGNIKSEKTKLTPGEFTTVKQTYIVTQTDLDHGEILNIATTEGTPVNYDPNDPNSLKSTDQDEDKITGKQEAEILREKESDVDKVTKAGQKVTYTFTITNTGNVTLTDFVLNDPILGGELKIDAETLAPGEAVTVKEIYEVTEADLNKDKLINVAEVIGLTSDNQSVSDNDSDEIQVIVPNSNGLLPKTATNLFNMLAIGSGLLVSGLGLFLHRRRKEA